MLIQRRGEDKTDLEEDYMKRFVPFGMLAVLILLHSQLIVTKIEVTS